MTAVLTIGAVVFSGRASEPAGAPRLGGDAAPQVLDGKAVVGSRNGELSRVVVSADGRGFSLAGSGERFVPWGVNYGNAGRLMEDFWADDRQRIVDDFREVRELGGNVVRVHLQFGKFMVAPDRANAKALERLAALLAVAEQAGLYLDVTGLACYRPADVPGWYDALDDRARWEAQAVFWRAVAECGARSSAVFCYDLMNEPISPGEKREKWYSGALLGGYDFIQYIARDPAGVPREELAVAWVRKLAAVIRQQDPGRLVTVGMLPWVTGWRHLSGFVPEKIAPEVDFLSVHIYPKTSQPNEAPRALRECRVGKPVVIEETFPLNCSVPELESFLRSSREVATGWIWHYDGITPAEYDAAEKREQLTVAQRIWRDALRSFVRMRPEMLREE